MALSLQLPSSMLKLPNNYCAARTARISANIFEVLCITTTWNHQIWDFNGNVSIQLRILHSLCSSWNLSDNQRKRHFFLFSNRGHTQGQRHRQLQRRRHKTIGSLRKHNVDGSENVIWKCNFSFPQSFLNYSKSSRLQMCSTYPGIKLEPAFQR